jgi:hypothetical protein
MSMRITTFILLAAVALASETPGAPALPKGWILPVHPAFDGAWRKTSPSRYLKAGADLNCDGIEDSVFILQPANGPGVGLFAFLGNGKGAYKAKLLFDSRKDGADLKGRTEKEVNKVQFWYRSLFGIKVVERGIYPTACGKGYMECGKNEKRKVEMECGGIDFFPFEEGGNINFFWEPRRKKFSSAVMGD